MSKPKISRQRDWQIKQKQAGLCIVCGEKAVTATHCEQHRIAFNKMMLKAKKKSRAKAK